MLPTLVRSRGNGHTPFGPLTHTAEDLFSDFADWWRGNGQSGDGITASYPADLRADGDKIVVDAEVPGFSKDEVTANLADGTLHIVAEHKEEKKKDGRHYLHERHYRRVERSISLPDEVDPDSIDAHLKDGVLHVEMKRTHSKSVCPIKVH
ncbi:Hsp20/alpha crystallin family protein [Phycisphaeraceae bacterium D3-23]